MHAAWTPWALERLLPMPSDDAPAQALLSPTSLRAVERALAKLGGAPLGADVNTEAARAIAARVNERYDERGNIARDRIGAQLVDAWCARAGVTVATQILVAACSEPQRLRPENPFQRAPYALRRDGQPWARLREHFCRASTSERAAAIRVAEAARQQPGELRYAVAYAFCVDAWVAADLNGALAEGYGRLALLAALRTSAQARGAVDVLLGGLGYVPPYQLIEEAPAHMPNLLRTLDDEDATLVVRAARLAWNAASRRPWREIVACLRGHPEADAWLAEHGA